MFKFFKRIKEIKAVKEAARIEAINVRLADERAKHERLCAEFTAKETARLEAMRKESSEKWKQRFREECELQGKQVPAYMK
ncbi:hypothetical protein [Paenibacillus sp. 1781tsa1]|uniref:hypothetical protein n=1 Tax=Paenibacillus sp. 1781tsa1 TaxID=2953810 RepID=UPI00209D6B3F|nr:hypothetical protein [Paenibacillus sp. 1781tsa1]MCP1185067.1 hypothetical protein [Paenibacillus sp. 1781tsa1]